MRETTPPEISSALVDGAMLTLTYDEALDEGSEPATNAFTAKVGGKDRDILAVSVDGRAVTFTLASAVTAEDTVTLNYIDKLEVFVSQLQTMEINRAKNFSLKGEDNHAAEFVRDVEGNYAPAFLELSVTNNTPGTENSQVQETAENPPAAPQGLTATANEDGSVTLTWETPDDDSITDYRVSRQQTDEDAGTTLTKVMDTGSTEAAFTDVSAAAGVSYEYFVQAINEAGLSEESNYALIALPQPPAPGQNTLATGLPIIDGIARVGETLTADVTSIADEDGLENAEYTHQWTRNDGSGDTSIQDATGSSYTLVKADEGRTVKVTVSFTDAEGNEETLTSDPTGAVAAKLNTRATGAPIIDGIARVGETLTADTSGIDDDDGLDNAAFTYQWIRNDGTDDTEIADATDADYTLTEDDEGKTIKVKVSFTDDEGNAESLTSDPTGEVEAAETVPDRPQDLDGEASAQGIKLTWKAPSSSAVTQYAVYRGILQNGSMNGQPMTKYATIDATGEAMAYTDASVESGVEYRYRVAAVNSAGEGGKSPKLDIAAIDSTP